MATPHRGSRPQMRSTARGVWFGALLLASVGLADARRSRRLAQASPATEASAPWPQPTYNFTLASAQVGLESQGSVSSSEAAVVSGATWTDDAVFGSVLSCSASSSSSVALPGVSYGTGQDGAFAISLWTRPAFVADAGLAYVLSQNNTGNTASDLLDANQLSIYYPSLLNTQFGVVRSVVRDSMATGSLAQSSNVFYLDSSGAVGSTNWTGGGVGNASVVGGSDWQHVVITTHPDGRAGWQLYLNGELSSEVVPGRTYLDTFYLVDLNITAGTAPMDMDGDLTLCGRADLSATRFYTGLLANLAIWDQALSPASVAEIYDATYASALRPGQAAAEVSQPGYDASQATYVRAGATTAAGTGAASLTSIVGNDVYGTPLCVPAGQNYSEASWPAGASEPISACGNNSTCGALSASALSQVVSPAAAASAVASGSIGVAGVCGDVTGAGWPTPSADLPVPEAFFPLAYASLTSWPAGDLGGAASPGAPVGLDPADPAWGSALVCGGEGSIVALDVPAYGASGRLSVSLWIRPTMQSDTDLAYVFSHSSGVPYASPGVVASPPGVPANEVAIYLPQGVHPAKGLVRAFIKDANDTAGNNVFVDSDGSVSSNVKRDASQLDASGNVVATASGDPLPDLYDGAYHHIALTTQPSGTAGYRLYVDGLLAGQIDPSTPTESTAYVGNFSLDGGGPIGLGPHAVLCTRALAPEGRYYSGRVSQVQLFSSSLTAAEVEIVYETGANASALVDANDASGEALTLLQSVASASSPASPAYRVGESGVVCAFPALFNGVVVSDCVDRGLGDGSTWCPVFDPVTATSTTGEASWEPCRAANDTISRTTTVGTTCVFPSYYETYGILAGDCLPLAGSAPSCTDASGAFVSCTAAPPSAGSAGLGSSPSPQAPPPPPSPGAIAAPLGPSDEAAASNASLGATSLRGGGGEPCLSPITYRGTAVDACVFVAGLPYCWNEAREAWGTCAPASYQEPRLGPNSTVATVPVLAVPSQARRTASGGDCALPYVPTGTNAIVEDCVDRSGNGTYECPNATGAWEACDAASAAAAQALEPAASLTTVVRVRQTTSGDPCALPFVRQGHLYLDCVDLGTGQAQCPTRDGALATCAGLTTLYGDVADGAADAGDAATGVNDDVTVTQLTGAVATNRTSPGPPGSLCDSEAASGSTTGCAIGLTCVPLPTFGGRAGNSLAYLGVCSDLPGASQAGLYGALRSAGVSASPLAAFPLATPSPLQPATLPTYRGVSSAGATWASDVTFGAVPTCDRSSGGYLRLQSVPYAAGGSFAVNIWFRRTPGGDVAGSLHQYVFSHTDSPADAGKASGIDAVAIYLPERAHPAFGSVRARVYDSAPDVDPTYLDSDGYVDCDLPRANGTSGTNLTTTTTSSTALPPVDYGVNDGNWHMVTVTSNEGGVGGFSLYLDGQLRARATSEAETCNGTTIVASGANPLTIPGDVYLCGRSDLDAQRFFDGQVSDLSLYDRALGEGEVAEVYAATVAAASLARATAEASPSPASPTSSPVPINSSGAAGASPDSFEESPEADAQGHHEPPPKMSGGAIAGLVIGLLAATALIAAVSIFAYRRFSHRGAGFAKYRDEPGSEDGGSKAPAGRLAGAPPPADAAAPVQPMTPEAVAAQGIQLGSLGSARTEASPGNSSTSTAEDAYGDGRHGTAGAWGNPFAESHHA